MKARMSLLAVVLTLSLVLTLTVSCKEPVATTPTDTTVTATVSNPTVPLPSTTTTPPASSTTEPAAEEGLTYGGTINITFTADPGSFDNYRFQGPGEMVQSFYLEKLLMGNWATPRNKHAFMGAYIPVEFATGNLAESWDNPDPLTYIIHLQKNVRWQDKPPVNGREFVASDVVYTYGRMLGRGIGGFATGTPYQTYPALANVKNIVAKDKYTVEFQLSAPIPLLLENLGLVDFIRMVPREVIDTYKDMNDWKNAVGTGPFILADYVSGSQVIFRKNPNYWGYDELNPTNKLPYVDYVRQSIIVDASTSLAAFRTGKIDTRTILWSDVNSVKQTNPDVLWKKTPSIGIVLAMRNDKEPFTDIRVRKAMQMAVNLQEISEEFYGGNTLGWLPEMIAPTLPYSTPSAESPKDTQEGFTYNVAGAKALLAAAGFPNGFKTEVLISPYHSMELVEFVQSYMEAVGITLEIKSVDLNSWTMLYYSKQTPSIAVYMAGWQSSPLSDGLNLYYPGHIYNGACVNDTVYKKLADDARSEPDAVKRAALIKQAVYYAQQQFWVVRLPIYVDYIAWQPWLSNYQGEVNLGAHMPGAVWARISVNQKLKDAMTR